MYYDMESRNLLDKGTKFTKEGMKITQCELFTFLMLKQVKHSSWQSTGKQLGEAKKQTEIH